MAQTKAISGVSNDGELTITANTPYQVSFQITGTAPLLFHRWSCDDVEAKASAKKGSKAKKEDNIEAYLYRNEAGEICLPTEYFRMALVAAAKFKQDPRSPRKSACDLFKAGLAGLEELCSLGVTEPDYIDRRRVTVQRNGITRCRPAIAKGWKCSVSLAVLTPEYISKDLLLETASDAGRLIGLADFRPTFGRFQVTKFDELLEESR